MRLRRPEVRLVALSLQSMFARLTATVLRGLSWNGLSPGKGAYAFEALYLKERVRRGC